jgi:hypothetical protein
VKIMRTQLSTLAVIMLASVGVGSPAAAAAAPHRTPQIIAVHGSEDGSVTISRHTVRAGRIVFRIDSAMPAGFSSGIALVRLNRNVALEDLFADLRQMVSDNPATRAKGTRDATRDARFYGLADLLASTPVSVTQTLHAATYHLIDLGALHTGTAPTTTLRVHGTTTDREESPGGPTVLMTSADRFTAPRFLPATGTVTVANTSHALHFMNIWPVQPGTTDAGVQAWLDTGTTGEGPFIDGPAIGLNVISPGRRAQLTYRLPPGTYLLFCAARRADRDSARLHRHAQGRDAEIANASYLKSCMSVLGG